MTNKVSSRFILSIIMILVGTFFGVGVFLLVIGPDSLVKTYNETFNQPSDLRVGMHIPDVETGYVNRPSLNNFEKLVAGRQVKYFTDIAGARVVSLPKSEQLSNDVTPILLMVGGSQTFGAGVFQEETFGHIAAVKLGRNARNFAISGLGTVSSTLMVERHLNQEGTVVLYGFWQDHLNRNLQPCVNAGVPHCISKPFIDWTAGENPLVKFPADVFQNAALSIEWESSDEKDRSDPKWQKIDEQRRSLLKKHGGNSAGTLLENALIKKRKVDSAALMLERINDYAKRKKSTLIIVYIPNYLNPELMEPMPIELSTKLEKADIAVIDMYSQFKERLNSGLEIALVGDGHLNIETHKLIGETVAEFIQYRAK